MNNTPPPLLLLPPPPSFTDIYSQLIGTNTPEKKSDYIMLRDKIAFIIECLLDATQPIEVIVRQTALEIAGSLPDAEKVELANNPNRGSILRGMTKDKLRENYFQFIQHLRKIRILSDILKMDGMKEENPNMDKLGKLDFQKMTLREWIMQFEINLREDDEFKDHFHYVGLGEMISGLQITNLKEFLNRTIISHIEDAEKAGF